MSVRGTLARNPVYVGYAKMFATKLGATMPRLIDGSTRTDGPSRRGCRPCNEEEELDEELLNGVVLPKLPEPNLKEMRSEAAISHNSFELL